MRRTCLIALAWACVMLTPPASRAHDFVFGIDQSIDLESNIFNDADDPTMDAAYVITPLVRFRQQERQISYDLRYRPSFEKYVRTDGISGWDQDLRGEASYLIGPADVSKLSGTVYRRRMVRDSFVDSPVSEPTVILSDRGRATGVDLDLEQIHTFSEKLSGSASVGYEDYTYVDAPSIDSHAVRGSLGLQQQVTKRDTLGISMQSSYRSFEARATQPGSQTTVLNGNLVFNREISPTIKLSVQAGPSYLLSHQAPGRPVYSNRFRLFQDGVGGYYAAVYDATPGTGCSQVNGQVALAGCSRVAPINAADPQFYERIVVDFDPGSGLGSQDETALTYFAAANLSKELQRGKLSLDFVRTEDTSSGLGATTVFNSLTAGATWQPADHWRLAAYGNWNQRDSAASFAQSVVRGGQSSVSTGVPGEFFAEANGLIPYVVPNDIDIQQFWVEASLTRAFSERAKLRLRFRYVNQDYTSTFAADRSAFENYIGTISFEYEFDPYTF